MRAFSRSLALGAIVASAGFVTSAFAPAPAGDAKDLLPEYCDTICGNVGDRPRSTPCTLRNGWPPGNTVNCGWWYDFNVDDF